MSCTGFERLLDHLELRLESAAAEAVAAHLARGCEQCISDKRWYESVTRVIAADDSVEPPPWVLKRVIRLFEGACNRRRLSARPASLVAALIYDSLGGPLFAGARTTEWIGHELLYRADHFKIDLLLESSGRRMNLRGQILREGESLCESTSEIGLELIHEGQLVHSTCTNQVGEFMIAAIEPARYELRIEVGEVLITVPGLAIV